jgi:CheY-like chemotaxis protein
MSGDLISLQILLVANAGPVHEIWRQGVAQVSVPVHFDAADGGKGSAALGRGGVDICIVDHDMSEADFAGAVKAAYAARPRPFIVVAAAPGAPRVHAADAMVSRPANAAQARKRAECCARARIPVRALVVDDSATTRRIVRKILRASRFALDVHEAPEGNAALQQVRSGKFGVVFLDYNMPGLDGFETLSEIRRADPEVAVVMITAAPDNAFAERVRKSGAIGLLRKPFYPDDVDAVLERYYGLHEVAV